MKLIAIYLKAIKQREQKRIINLKQIKFNC